MADTRSVPHQVADYPPCLLPPPPRHYHYCPLQRSSSDLPTARSSPPAAQTAPVGPREAGMRFPAETCHRSRLVSESRRQLVRMDCVREPPATVVVDWRRQKWLMREQVAEAANWHWGQPPWLVLYADVEVLALWRSRCHRRWSTAITHNTVQELKVSSQYMLQHMLSHGQAWEVFSYFSYSSHILKFIKAFLIFPAYNVVSVRLIRVSKWMHR